MVSLHADCPKTGNIFNLLIKKFKINSEASTFKISIQNTQSETACDLDSEISMKFFKWQVDY